MSIVFRTADQPKVLLDFSNLFSRLRNPSTPNQQITSPMIEKALLGSKSAKRRPKSVSMPRAKT